jgi:hypothetical protein
MKNIFFVLMFISGFCFGQDQPFKGANTLVLTTDHPELFKEIGKQLIQDGYEIENSNSEFQTITTSWREIKWIKYRLIVSVVDKGFQIQCKLMNEAANGVLNTTGSDWLLEWKKSGVENDAWERMEVFAAHFGTEKKYFQK